MNTKKIGVLHAWPLVANVMLAGCSSDAIGSKADVSVELPTRVLAASASSPITLGPLQSIAQFRQQRGSSARLGQDPADLAFSTLASAFAAGTHKAIHLAVYDLATASGASVVASPRAHALGLDIPSAAQQSASDGSLRISAGGWDLNLDPTGDEYYLNPSLDHKGQPTNAIQSDDVYETKAAAYIASSFPPLTGPMAAYSSIVNHYHDSKVSYTVAGDPTTRGQVSDGIYEIAVVHNTAIDGLPVIGPGGKYKVWMSPTGDVLAHKSTVRNLAGVHTYVGGDQLVNPSDAQSALESKLTARGVHLNQYALAEAQFGYFRRGPGRVQSIVAPYYLFFYKPTSAGQKSIMEMVPAVQDPTALAAITADEAAYEATRPPRGTESGQRTPSLQ